MLQSLEEHREHDPIVKISIAAAGAVVIAIALAVMLLAHHFVEEEEITILGDLPESKLAQAGGIEPQSLSQDDLSDILEAFTEEELNELCASEGVECIFLDEEGEEVLELEEEME